MTDYWMGFCNGATVGVLVLLATMAAARYFGGRKS
jgi:hypothetical protein